MIQGDIMTRIRQTYPTLSKGQKRLADFILEHYDKAVYMTAVRLGEAVGVSESTVVRFAFELGYDGYPEMQRSLEEVISVRLTALQRMEVSRERMDKDHVLSSVMQSDMNNIKDTLSLTDEETFKKAADLILKARYVYILGVRSAEPLASFLGYYLNLIMDNVRLISTNSISETFEQILNIGPEDVLIGISFPRYSKRTVKVMQFASSRGAGVIAVTDRDESPIASEADCVLKAQCHMVSFVDSLAGPLSLITALIVQISLSRQQQVEKNLATLESIWREYDVYETSGDDAALYGHMIS